MTKRIMIMGITTSLAALVAEYLKDYDIEAKKSEYDLENLCKAFEYEEPVKVPKLQEFTGLNKKRGKGKTKRWDK